MSPKEDVQTGWPPEYPKEEKPKVRGEKCTYNFRQILIRINFVKGNPGPLASKAVIGGILGVALVVIVVVAIALALAAGGSSDGDDGKT